MPEKLLPYWNGFYEEMDLNDPEMDHDYPDLELPDGRLFRINDEFDFDHPQTDYDRLCGYKASSEHFLYPVGPGEILAIGDYSDGATGWWWVIACG